MENKKKIKINKKVIIPVAIVCLIIIAIILMYIFKKNNNIITTSMQFDYLGYDNFYENDEDTVTVKEANGILMSLYFEKYENTTEKQDVDKVAINDYWMEYGYNNNVVSISEGNKKLTYLRFYEMLYDTRIQIGEETRYTSNELNLNSEEYQQNYIEALNMLYNNGFITTENIDSNSIHNYVTKEYFEDIIVKYVFKYNLTAIRENEIDYEASFKIPQNKNYFFVLKNTSKKELEYKTVNNKDSHEYMSPKEVYAYMPSDISKINNLIKNYFTTILNVKAENIDESGFKYNVRGDCIVAMEDVENYCNYVKENNIDITGNATVISPIIYKVDGVYYVRTKIQLNINNSNTKIDLLFGDLGSKVKYSDNTVRYIDVPVQKETFGWKIANNNLVTCIVK